MDNVLGMSIFLLSAAFAITVFSVRSTIALKNHASGHPSLKSLFFISIIAVVSFVVVTAVLLVNNPFPPESTLSTVILFESALCYIAVTLSGTLFRRFHHEAGKAQILESRLKELSIIDPLTDLYNHRGFLMFLEHHLSLARRNREEVLFCYVELENLEDVRDRMGHEEVNLMILETSRLLKSSFRSTDIVSRISDNEFMVFLEGSSPENTETIARSFGEKIESNNMDRHRKYHPPIQFAVVPYDPSYNAIFENILAQAGDFLRRVKTESQKNSMCINA